MQKKLTRHGNSLALVIDRAILDLLKIDAETPLELATDGDALIVRPLRQQHRRARLDAALEELNEDYGASLRALDG